MKNRFLSMWTILFLLLPWQAFGAQSSTQKDSLQHHANAVGGIYDRPYITRPGSSIAVGGYTEMNSNFVREAGVEEGLSFEARRFNVFFYSAISERVKLTSELEFEHGTEEIALETALVDILLLPAINLRAGILLPPIGRFNITHDSPRYDIVDRPFVSTEIIPATLSEVGIGLFGALYPTRYDRLTYEIYAVNGLRDGVVGGFGGGTRLAAGKSGDAFEEDNNGSPALTGRLALNPAFGGEFGLSFYTGYYNSFKIEGEKVDDQRRATILAADMEYRWRRFLLRGEGALARIDVPSSLSELFGSKQMGVYAELGYRLLRRSIMGFPEASLSLVMRYDYIDLNDGTFTSTGQEVGDTHKRITMGLSFRPSTETSVRLCYARDWQRDALSNLSHRMNIQFGIATYF